MLERLPPRGALGIACTTVWLGSLGCIARLRVTRRVRLTYQDLGGRRHGRLPPGCDLDIKGNRHDGNQHADELSKGVAPPIQETRCPARGLRSSLARTVRIIIESISSHYHVSLVKTCESCTPETWRDMGQSGSEKKSWRRAVQ